MAVAHDLHKKRYYIRGCKQLIIATDHRPLLNIFGDRNLKDIRNPRLLNFKEKVLQLPSFNHSPLLSPLVVVIQQIMHLIQHACKLDPARKAG